MKSKVLLLILDGLLIFGLTNFLQGVGYEKAYGYPSFIECLPLALLITIPLHLLILLIHSKMKFAIIYRVSVAILCLMFFTPPLSLLLNLGGNHDTSIFDLLIFSGFMIGPYLFIVFILQHEIQYIYGKIRLLSPQLTKSLNSLRPQKAWPSLGRRKKRAAP
jgi:hypothetical protein